MITLQHYVSCIESFVSPRKIQSTVNVHTAKSDEMKNEELPQVTDKELLKASEANKPSPIVDAFFIGLLIGIIIYSVAANTWGFFTLIPLFMIYRLMKKSKQRKALNKEIKHEKHNN